MTGRYSGLLVFGLPRGIAICQFSFREMVCQVVQKSTLSRIIPPLLCYFKSPIAGNPIHLIIICGLEWAVLYSVTSTIPKTISKRRLAWLWIFNVTFVIFFGVPQVVMGAVESHFVSVGMGVVKCNLTCEVDCKNEMFWIAEKLQRIIFFLNQKRVWWHG